MTGAPGEPRVDGAQPPLDAEGADDTTTAEAGPPASRRDDTAHDAIPDSSHDPGLATHPSATDLGHPTRPDGTGEHEVHGNEDRTVQQKVGPPGRPPAPKPAAGAPPSSSPIPSTEPSGALAVAVASITQTNEMDSSDITGELGSDLTDDAEPLEDSITATAPRLDHAHLMDAARSGVPVVIPGAIEIHTVEHEEDSLDETEIRTLPGTPLQIPATLRGAVPAPRPAAGRPPTISPESDNEGDDDGITTRAIAPAMSGAPSSKAPSTRLSGPGAPLAMPRAASPRPAAGMPFRPEVVQAPPTRPGAGSAAVSAIETAEELATRPGVEGAEEPATRPGVEGVDEPATRPGLGESPTRPGKPDPETADRRKRVDVAEVYDNEDDDGEGITARSRVPETYDEEESVTTQAPAVPSAVIDAAINKAPRGVADAMLDDGTDGTTQRVKKTREAARSSPADSEAESITTQAPGPLTNILRVIASGSSPGLDNDELPTFADDEPPENRTAVMANAPLKRVMAELASSSPLPAIRPTGGPLIHGAAAPRLEPSSESGLRVTRSAEVERASLGALGLAGDRNGRSSGVGPHANAIASDGSMGSPMDRAQMNADGVFPSQPSVHDVDLGKGPRYGLLVAIVGVLSIAVPVTLFLVLHHSADGPAVAGTPSEPASEIEKHDGTRVKAVRGKNGQMTAPSASVAPSASASASASSTPSASPSTSASSKPGGRGFPFRR